jgi:CRP-like cAMP-binding protein
MKKVLLIEDNEDVRETTADILELANYKVATAEDGKVGVKLAKQFAPDIILCDIMMPELNGYGVLQILSKDPKTASIPFVFLTAKSEKSDWRKGMNLGADDYLTKPFEENELLDVLECRLKKNEFLKKEFTRNLEGINSFFEEASEYVDLENLTKKQLVKNYNKNETIYAAHRSAHSLYFIQSGIIKTYRTTESGKEFVIGVHGPGEFIGQLSLLSDTDSYMETAKVLEDAEIFAIPKEDFLKLLFSNHQVSNKFIQFISNNLIDIQEQLVNMAFASVRQRTAQALLDLYDKGIIKDTLQDGVGIPREDFAGIIGTATETAIRTLSEFKEEGLIAMGTARKLILLNKDKLRKIADFV